MAISHLGMFLPAIDMCRTPLCDPADLQSLNKQFIFHTRLRDNFLPLTGLSRGCWWHQAHHYDSSWKQSCWRDPESCLPVDSRNIPQHPLGNPWGEPATSFQWALRQRKEIALNESQQIIMQQQEGQTMSAGSKSYYHDLQLLKGQIFTCMAKPKF